MTSNEPSDFGQRLRAARERSGLSLRQIADVTKLSVRTLDLLEHNRIAQLPGGIYRRAIVRAYASEIGLDPERTLRAFLAEHPDEVPSGQATAEPAPPSPRPLRRVIQAVAGVVGAGVLLIAGLFSDSRTALR